MSHSMAKAHFGWLLSRLLLTVTYPPLTGARMASGIKGDVKSSMATFMATFKMSLAATRGQKLILDGYFNGYFRPLPTLDGLTPRQPAGVAMRKHKLVRPPTI
jgi:hypothetical protein